MTAILWLTRDLRAHDQPALRAALDRHDRVVPVFCFDSRLLGGRHASATRTRFMLECLEELDERLGGIVFRDGRPERELPALAAELEAEAVHASADVGPFARRRLAAVKRALDCELVLHPGVAAVDDLGAVRTQAGKPYTVFSPFHRSWLEEPRREVIGRPASAARAAVRRAQGEAADAAARWGSTARPRMRRAGASAPRAGCSPTS